MADRTIKYTLTTGGSEGWYNATTSAAYIQPYFYVTEEPEKRRRMMNIYRVYVVDAFKGVMLSEYTVVGKDEGEAALALSLTEAEKALKERDDLEIIWQKVGEFEKREVTRTRQA